MAKEKIILGWSGGKDSALALDALRRSGTYDVVALVTTCTEGANRVSMHGVRCELLDQQAKAIGLPLTKVFISHNADNSEYETKMSAAFCEFRKQGIHTAAFGDLFLTDIRAYRDRMLNAIGMKAIYPVWDLQTKKLAQYFVTKGFKAFLVCIDPRKLGSNFAGRLFDETLLRQLPHGVDHCGEHGEFHTFVFDGPIFHHPIGCTPGEVVKRGDFWFCELYAKD